MARPKSPVDYNLGRLNRVIDLVEAGLDKNLVLDDLAREAAFSPFHFHRLFHRWYGETPRDFVRRRRLEQGASLLHYSPAQVTHIAARCGFNTAEGFGRAFRQHFGVSPNSWRSGGYQDWRRTYAPPPTFCNDDAPYQVRVLSLPDTRVAYLRRIGPYGVGTGNQWARLAEWMQAHHLNGLTRYGIGLDNPAVTPLARCRYDVCVALPDTFIAPPHTPTKTIPGGRYAVLEFCGAPTESGAAWLWLLEHWLPRTGFTIDRMFTFERYRPDLREPSLTSQACELCLALSPSGRH